MLLLVEKPSRKVHAVTLRKNAMKEDSKRCLATEIIEHLSANS
jgi:hypothetical protein